MAGHEELMARVRAEVVRRRAIDALIAEAHGAMLRRELVMAGWAEADWQRAAYEMLAERMYLPLRSRRESVTWRDECPPALLRGRVGLVTDEALAWRVGSLCGRRATKWECWRLTLGHPVASLRGWWEGRGWR